MNASATRERERRTRRHVDEKSTLAATKKWVVNSRRGWWSLLLPLPVLVRHLTTKRIASHHPFSFYYHFPPSRSPQHLSRLLDRSDYDDPSTTTLRSFSFDLWITDNRIRRTRRSSYSMINRAPPPFHPAFFSSFTRIRQIFSSFRDFFPFFFFFFHLSPSP